MQVAFVDTKPHGIATHDFPRESVQHAAKPGGNGVGNGVGGTNPKVRKWLSVNTTGLASTLELSKIRVHHELGIQLRDLRLLDPLLASSYPSALLARDRALIVNLEFIKMIITLDRVFITNLDDPNTNMFIEELQRRLKHPAGSATAMGVTPSTAALGALLNPPAFPLQTHQTNQQAQAQEETEHVPHKHGILGTAANAIFNNTLTLNSATATTTTTAAAQLQPPQHLQQQPPQHHAALSSVHHPGLGPHFSELSFDLRVLECALDVVSGYLESQAADLEAAAHPALDALTLKISTNNLERVRRVKNRMVRLMTRAETLKELLEKLLDDDSNMKSLNLTAKEAEREDLIQRQSLRHSMSMSASTPFDVPIPTHLRKHSSWIPQASVPEVPESNPITNNTFRNSRNSTGNGGTTQPPLPQPNTNYTSTAPANPSTTATNMLLSAFNNKIPGSNNQNNDDTLSEDLSSDEGVEVVEQLVEAYFMMVDNTWNKLQTLAEYIDDTEDFINIELDSHRNQLIRLDLVLTSATASISLITAVTSLFAMNVSLDPSFEDKAPYSWFVTISVSSSVLAIVVFISVMSYCRYKRLI